MSEAGAWHGIGRNENGQLGLLDRIDREVFTPLRSISIEVPSMMTASSVLFIRDNSKEEVANNNGMQNKQTLRH